MYIPATPWLFPGAIVRVAHPPPDCDVSGLWVVESVLNGSSIPPTEEETREAARGRRACLRQGERTAVLMCDGQEPELMIRLADFLTADPTDLLEWLAETAAGREVSR